MGRIGVTEEGKLTLRDYLESAYGHYCCMKV